MRVDSNVKGEVASSDPFILKLLHLILSYGVEIKASDIHLEPTVSGGRVRYRIDGMLHEMLLIPPETREVLIRALKVKANMATDVVGRSKPQDSRIDFEFNNRKLDLRLSSFPTLYGDVIAIRILDRSGILLELSQIGFSPSVFSEYQRLIRKPNGLVLVTGPAGSGKTTTLYAGLNQLRSPHIKIVTLEDPVEYQMEGADQAQINPSVGLTFASGLRAILRQDSNIILVGEIRDQETADIAIRAALTGHLVFSTMHTRHSPGAVTRLIDMGIEPHLILAAINGIVAQRLVRLLCRQCQLPADSIAVQTFSRFWSQEMSQAPSQEMLGKLRKAQGCAACNGTGYQGRIGIFELLVLNDELKQQVLDRTIGSSYRRLNLPGWKTMLQDGLDKAGQGLITIEEVLRVVGETEES
ncbi:MAG: type II/IV secretion system protein [Candidatus Omnitrophica bacterium]|nr:type II/IV secretion system protein [Candidatus Omnitrophota bacterium]